MVNPFLRTFNFWNLFPIPKDNINKASRYILLITYPDPCLTYNFQCRLMEGHPIARLTDFNQWDVGKCDTSKILRTVSVTGLGLCCASAITIDHAQASMWQETYRAEIPPVRLSQPSPHGSRDCRKSAYAWESPAKTPEQWSYTQSGSGDALVNLHTCEL